MIMPNEEQLDAFIAKYLELARSSKSENRMLLNHICIRVEDLDAAEELLCDSFGLDAFLSPGGETFDEEKEYRVTWLHENNIYLEISQFEREQQIGYETGVGQPIGHLSEVGFFVPDMDRALADLSRKGWEVTSAIDTEGARMYKIYNPLTPGIPVELIDCEADTWGGS
jgi:catechol 2,3-dioxygenase-like lactoylglutathione lyase family enzyme